jgi:acyl-CoA synthetase (AMP-forming)/AMP-acid ligase II
MLLSDYLKKSALEYPDNEAIINQERRVSYREFNSIVEKVAFGLLELGIQKGDRIALMMPTIPEFLYFYMAASQVGAIVVGINMNYKAPEIEYIIKNSEPSLLVTVDRDRERDYIADLKGILPNTGVIKVIVHKTTDYALDFADAIALEDFIAENRDHLREEMKVRHSKVGENDGVLIVYTSGTTGHPKGAVLTHRNIISNIEVEARMWEVTPADRFPLCLPMNHVGGATEVSIAAIMKASTMVMFPFHPVSALELMEKEKLTLMLGVPTMFALMFNVPDFDKYDLTSVRIVVVAGAATPRDLMEKMMGIAPVRTGWGLTECCGFATYTISDDDAETIISTVGRIAPEFELKIVDSERREVAQGRDGEIAIRGDFIMKEYFRMPEATKQAVDEDGWLYTGDMGFIREDGNVILRGRLKEMYITGGYNVYPTEIEDVLAKHPGVLMCVCLGQKDPVYGEVGLAVVQAEDKNLNSENLRAFLKDKLADYKIPRDFIFIDSMPLTPLGKIDKKAVAQQYSD